VRSTAELAAVLWCVLSPSSTIPTAHSTTYIPREANIRLRPVQSPSARHPSGRRIRPGRAVPPPALPRSGEAQSVLPLQHGGLLSETLTPQRTSCKEHDGLDTQRLQRGPLGQDCCHIGQPAVRLGTASQNTVDQSVSAMESRSAWAWLLAKVYEVDLIGGSPCPAGQRRQPFLRNGESPRLRAERVFAQQTARAPYAAPAVVPRCRSSPSSPILNKSPGSSTTSSRPARLHRDSTPLPWANPPPPCAPDFCPPHQPCNPHGDSDRPIHPTAPSRGISSALPAQSLRSPFCFPG